MDGSKFVIFKDSQKLTYMYIKAKLSQYKMANSINFARIKFAKQIFRQPLKILHYTIYNKKLHYMYMYMYVNG